MKWFIALNQQAFVSSDYASLAKVALQTATEQTQLEPHVLYDGDDNEFTRWLESRQVPVWRVRSCLYEQLGELGEQRGKSWVRDIGSGAMLRVELPRWAAEQSVRDQHVLYTDCDVMFAGAIDAELRRQRPRAFAVAPDADPSDWLLMNTGVMVMNLPRLRADLPEFLAYIRRDLLELSLTSWDNEAYIRYYRRRLGRLSGVAGRLERRTPIGLTYRWGRLPVTWNWKPYWGEPPSDVRVVHFHGPKPYHRQVFAEQPEGEWPEGLAPQRAMARGAYDHLTTVWYAALDRANASPPPGAA